MEPLIPIYQRGVLYGDATVRETAATGLGELIKITQTKFLAGPFLIKLTGPLLRIVGDRNPSNVKIAIVQVSDSLSFPLFFSINTHTLVNLLFRLWDLFLPREAPSSEHLSRSFKLRLSKRSRIHPDKCELKQLRPWRCSCLCQPVSIH